VISKTQQSAKKFLNLNFEEDEPQNFKILFLKGATENHCAPRTAHRALPKTRSFQRDLICATLSELPSWNTPQLAQPPLLGWAFLLPQACCMMQPAQRDAEAPKRG
jgi:hypothetical protein